MRTREQWYIWLLSAPIKKQARLALWWWWCKHTHTRCPYRKWEWLFEPELPPRVLKRVSEWEWEWYGKVGTRESKGRVGYEKRVEGGGGWEQNRSLYPFSGGKEIQSDRWRAAVRWATSTTPAFAHTCTFTTFFHKNSLYCLSSSSPSSRPKWWWWWWWWWGQHRQPTLYTSHHNSVQEWKESECKKEPFLTRVPNGAGEKKCPLITSNPKCPTTLSRGTLGKKLKEN